MHCVHMPQCISDTYTLCVHQISQLPTLHQDGALLAHSGLYRQAGCANKPTVFLFDETQIVFETFLEDVNNILTSGE